MMNEILVESEENSLFEIWCQQNLTPLKEEIAKPDIFPTMFIDAPNKKPNAPIAWYRKDTSEVIPRSMK